MFLRKGHSIDWKNLRKRKYVEIKCRDSENGLREHNLAIMSFLDVGGCCTTGISELLFPRLHVMSEISSGALSGFENGG